MKLTKKILALGTAAVAITLITASSLTSFASPKNGATKSFAKAVTEASDRTAGNNNGGECVNPDGVCDGTTNGKGTGIGNGGECINPDGICDGTANGKGTGIGNGGECANPDGVCDGTGNGNSTGSGNRNGGKRSSN